MARGLGYPVLVRPSYVLGGRAMVIAYDEEMVRQYMREAVTFSQDRPVLVDRFLEDATEVDVDALADGDDVLIAGIMEHIEEAGVHSGDSSCVLPPQSLPEKSIRTIEGLADGDKIHPLQRAFIEHHGLQCGFCTPGFLMLAASVLEREPNISDKELVDVLSSNLCRCTGYQNIIKAVRAAAAEMRPR